MTLKHGAWLGSPNVKGMHAWLLSTYIQNSYTALLHSILAGRINYRNYKCQNKLTVFVLVAYHHFVDVQIVVD